MAPIPAQAPTELDLSKCFSGEQQLISWDIAYTALCDPDNASKSVPLRNFLTAEENHDILSKPWSPFAEPSAQEKSKFEAKTAPISVTPATDSSYNIEQIKEDSLWLSQQARISEYAALRLVVLEWQSRPALQLLSGFTEEEALSVRDAAGLSSLPSAQYLNASVLNSSIAASPFNSADAQFESSDQRRLRLFELYSSTRVSILRISQLLLSWGAAKALRPECGRGYRVCEDWLEQLGQSLAARQNRRESEGLDQCHLALKARYETLANGFTWNLPESIQDAVEEKWVVSQITEMVHLLHIAILHADLHAKKFVAAATIEQWMSSMLDWRFFLEFPLPLPNGLDLFPVIQMLSSLLCLALLKVNVVLDDLSTGQYTSWDKSSYVLNGSLLETMTNIFGIAKQLGPSPATPPAFAWAIIIWRLTTEASDLEQDRDHQIEAGPRNSLPAPSVLEEAVLPLTRLEASDLFDKKMPFQDLAETCSNFGVMDLVNQLVGLAMSTFGTPIDRISRDRFRFLLLHLIRAGLGSEIVSYGPELIVSAHAILTGDRSFRNWVREGSQASQDPIAQFVLHDDAVLYPQLLEQARVRYPYEITPLLKFYSALTRGEKLVDGGMPSAASLLAKTSTLMQRLPEHFSGYSSIREEENANFVALSVDLPQFASGSSTSSFRGARRLLTSTNLTDSHEPMVIPAGTEGRIVDDSAQPFVALWHYPHPALEYLVRLLTTYVIGSNKVEFSSQQPVSLQSATEIVGLFADLLHSSLRSSTDPLDDSRADLLKALDIGVDRNQDTVSVVLAIFEQEVLRLCQEPGNVESLELLVNCVHFLQALIVIAPSRVWPWITRSRLLESDGNGGSLAAILIGTEMVIGRYDFLIGCIHLFQALIKDAVGRSIARKSASRALTRFNNTSTSESGTSEKAMSSTLLTFGRTLASIFESSMSWKYVAIEDRLEINIGICEAFTTILEYAYRIDDTPQLSLKLTGFIAPVAEYITNLYLSKAEGDVPTNPVLASLLSGTGPDKGSLSPSSTIPWKRQTHTALLFSNILVRVAILLERPWTTLEQQLFKATPLLARLYTANDVYKSAVIHLLESLVRGAVRITRTADPNDESNGEKKAQTDPPSLLGHLGPRTAKNFLSVLSQLDEPLKTVEVQTQVWNLLTAVVTCQQQWFALYLLTGTTPRDSVKTKTSAGTGVSRSKALLSRALEALSRLELDKPNRDWPLFTAMLEFVSSAQNHWSWAMGDLRQHKGFIKQLLNFLKWIASQPKDLKTNEGVTARSFQNRFASLACEIIAMYLHSSRQISDSTPLNDIIPSLEYLEDNALELPSYNSSLHTNLKRNFEKTFQGVVLSKLKRTTLYSQPFGRNFFYDVDFANLLLGYNGDWSGSRNDKGYAAEVERANLNLGLIESQRQLLQSWKLLVVELSKVLEDNQKLEKIFIKVVEDSMTSNAESTLPEALFGQLRDVRAELSFVVLQRMVQAGTKNPDARLLLPKIWTAVRASATDFDTVFSSDQAQYYRSLLRILYLSLQFHLIDESASSDSDKSFRFSFRGTLPESHRKLVQPIAQQLLEILSEVIAKGFRGLATQLHSDPGSVSPSDFALLTAILQKILIIPEMVNWHAQAALIFSNSNTLRYATSLFSWSDRLTLPNNGVNDPIYGELSLLFILSLSSMQPLAETMAVEGILSQLNAANLMNFYKRAGGMSPFDSPTRLFSIWVKGILPLCLNLLQAVGPPIAGEISAFLNQYSEQLTRASNALNSRTANKITLSTASESHSLALIASILENVRAQGPRLGVQASEIPVLDFDKENVKEDIEGWMARKGALRERIVVTDESEAALFSRKSAGDGADNLLEERILRELDAAGDCLGLGRESKS